MIIEFPTLEDCLEIVHDVSNKMATDNPSTNYLAYVMVFRQITWIDFKQVCLVNGCINIW